MKNFFNSLIKNKVIFAGLILLGICIVFFGFGYLNPVCSALGLIALAALLCDVAAWFIIKSKKVSVNKTEEFVPMEKREVIKEKGNRVLKKTDCIVCATVFIAFALVFFYYGFINLI